jgi:hypothetical protein
MNTLCRAAYKSPMLWCMKTSGLARWRWRAGIMALGACASLGLAQGRLERTPTNMSGGKWVAKSVRDLPGWSHRDRLLPSAIFGNAEAMERLRGSLTDHLHRVRANYELRESGTLRNTLFLEADLAMLDGDWVRADGLLRRSAELGLTPAKDELLEREAVRIVAATRAERPQIRHTELGQELEERLALTLADFVESKRIDRLSFAMRDVAAWTPANIRQGVEMQLDWVANTKRPVLSLQEASTLIAARRNLEVLWPIREAIAGACARALQAKGMALVQKGCWDDRLADLAPGDVGTPVIVTVWDSGVDVNLYRDRLFTNPRELLNALDDDGNGFVDDLHGIGWEADHPVPELLIPMQRLLAYQREVRDGKGMGEGERGYAQSVYSHGTNVAFLVSDGNPFVRILTVRMSFIDATEESISDARRTAFVPGSVAYVKAMGARVVQMSWGTSHEPTRRAIEAGVRVAPEVLFVVSAGNDSRDNQRTRAMLADVDAPNVLLVGALDRECQPARFTSWGERVKLFSWGVDVPGMMPGGRPDDFGGTSAAAPVVTNLAAKLLALDPALTPAELITLIMEGGTELDGHPGCKTVHPRRTIELFRERLRTRHQGSGAR